MMAQPQSEHAEYAYLEARPHKWRRQLYLCGRNMTVGQLIATMNANKMSPEEAAENICLPLAQVHEALAYYAANSDLVDSELREEKRFLLAKGYIVEPPPVSR